MNRIIHFEHAKPQAKIKAYSFEDTDYYTDVNDFKEVRTPFFLDEYKQDINAAIRLLARYIVPYLVVFSYCSAVPTWLIIGVHLIVKDVIFLGVTFLLMLFILTLGFIFWVYLAKNRIYYK